MDFANTLFSRHKTLLASGALVSGAALCAALAMPAWAKTPVTTNPATATRTPAATPELASVAGAEPAAGFPLPAASQPGFGASRDAMNSMAALTQPAPSLGKPTELHISLNGQDSFQQGQASWYGPGFHNRLTANGERYDMNALTAAHKTLPFGTLVRVKSVSTGKSVVVRINDRGPYAKGRIIDLSRAAAEQLGVKNHGVYKVILYKEPKGRGKPQQIALNDSGL